MTYLDQAATFSQLLRNNKLEQFIGAVTLSGMRGVRWLELRPTLRGIELWVFDVQDVGAPGHNDLYSFPPLNESVMPFAVQTFDTSRKAVQYAQEQYAAAPLRWALVGQARDDYAEFLAAGRSALWSSLGGEPDDE